MRRHEHEAEGFTLIELLVVVLILGVLVAVALPSYMSQRRSGYDAAARSDLQNLAKLQESWLVVKGGYASGAELDDPVGSVAVSGGVDLRVVSYEGARGYCISATHSGSSTTWFYDSLGGGQQDRGAAACPNTYAQADGQQIRPPQP